MRKRLLTGLLAVVLTVGVGVTTRILQSHVGGAVHIACTSSYCSGGG